MSRWIRPPGRRPPRGALFVSWLTDVENPAFDRGTASTALVRDLLMRGVVVSDVDPAQSAAFTLPADRGRIAVLDVDHVGLAAILGEGKGTLVGSTAVFDNGPAGAAPPVIALASHPRPDRPGSRSSTSRRKRSPA